MSASPLSSSSGACTLLHSLSTSLSMSSDCTTIDLIHPLVRISIILLPCPLNSIFQPHSEFTNRTLRYRVLEIQIYAGSFSSESLPFCVLDYFVILFATILWYWVFCDLDYFVILTHHWNSVSTNVSGLTMGEGSVPPMDPPPPYSPPRTGGTRAVPVQPVIVYVERTAPPNYGCWKTAFLTILIFQTIGVTGLTLMFSSALIHPDVSDELATLMVAIICLSMTHVIVGWVGATKQSTSFLSAYLLFSLIFIFISRILYLEHQGRTSGPNTLFSLLSIVVTLGYMRKIKDHRLASRSEALRHPELAMWTSFSLPWTSYVNNLFITLN